MTKKRFNISNKLGSHERLRRRGRLRETDPEEKEK